MDGSLPRLFDFVALADAAPASSGFSITGNATLLDAFFKVTRTAVATAAVLRRAIRNLAGKKCAGVVRGGHDASESHAGDGAEDNGKTEGLHCSGCSKE